MHRIDPGDDFDSWRLVARQLLANDVPPGEILWETADSLFPTGTFQKMEPTVSVPADFVKFAKTVACCNDPARWPLLYQILWRITKKNERYLLAIPSDKDISKARAMEKNVRREIHKMHAFVRFRKVGENEEGRERFVAWFEPDHFVVKAGTPFFCKRFANMDWSIFTPKGCAHWINKELHFTDGVSRDPSEQMDELEAIWRTYYKSTFNPSRLKIKTMQSEMPKKYWKNLPEADLIESLVKDSRGRMETMLETPLRPLRPEPKNGYLKSLHDLSAPVSCAGKMDTRDLGEIAKFVSACRQCALWQHATQAVPGMGPRDARIMIVGEQPGDREDLEGRPFVGPAGKLLDDALKAAMIDRDAAYLTNAVKHFKWEPRGKKRKHVNPNIGEINACKPWLLAELASVKPEVLIILGNTAARSLLGTGVQLLKQRGEFPAPNLAPKVILTVHPSFLLRLPDEQRRKEEYQLFVNDLRLAG